MDTKYKTFKKHFDVDNLTASEFELLITELCNLNCKGYCSEGGPGTKTMTSGMIDSMLKPFKSISTLKILGGEPYNAPHIVEHIYDNIDNNGIKINELWMFTNGLEKSQVEKLCEIIVYKPKCINNLFLYVSRGIYHDQAIKAINRNPQEADDNIDYLKAKFGRVIAIEKQWDEEIPLNVGHARILDNNPVKVSRDTRQLILFGENKLQKLVFSPWGYERPDFCNPEDVEKLTFGHVIDEGMEIILSRGLHFIKMDDKGR